MESAERETIINWNDAEDTINVFTCHPKIMRKMEALGASVKDKCVLNGKLRHVEYEISKNRVNITIRPKRVLSDAQRQTLSNRMKATLKKAV